MSDSSQLSSISLTPPDPPGAKDDDDDKNIWHPQQEIILARWSEEAASYRYMHDRAYKNFQSKNMWFSLPVIILSTIAGTANFSQGSVPVDYREYMALGTGFINLMAGLITTVSQFLKVGENLEGHRAASIDFGKLSRNIAVELSLPTNERSATGRNFLGKCRIEMERLMEKSPDISLTLIKKFGKKFNNSKFHKPNILEINSVEIFEHDAEKEATKRMHTIQRVTQQNIDQAAKMKQRAQDKQRRATVSATSIHDSMSALLSDLKKSSPTNKAMIDGTNLLEVVVVDANDDDANDDANDDDADEKSY